ncbi:phage capsid protein [Weissella confusa]|uniref:phage capsid protein n=1 Tax=Weissella confusa TaxID=1583 RepID=UPI001C6F8DAA|nr:phage capsid protein [Weissella confusa]QYU58204.1 phage capsid protein [Weissella confusa]
MTANEQLYTPQFMTLIQSVFRAQSAFQPTFGDMQAIDGITNSKTMFSVKTNDMPVVFNEYNTDADVAFGKGTSNSSRFGELSEVIYEDKEVPYEGTWAFNEGMDRFTVNADLNQAVADRLDAQAQAKIRKFNKYYGTKLVDNAAGDLGSVDDVAALFSTADETFTNLEIMVPVRAYVTPDVYNAIVDSKLATTAKGSNVNIDTNTYLEFKGFAISKTPEQYMNNAKVIFVPDNIGRAFVGIETVRTVESEDFNGIKLQGAGKYGSYISSDNSKAIFTAGLGGGPATTTTTTEATTTQNQK